MRLAARDFQVGQLRGTQTEDVSVLPADFEHRPTRIVDVHAGRAQNRVPDRLVAGATGSDFGDHANVRGPE